MLLKTLKAGAESLKRKLQGNAPAEEELPHELERRMGHLHARAPVDRHLDILLGEARFGEESFPQLYRRCLRDTGTLVTPYNVFHRFGGRLNLVRYVLAGIDRAGARAEIGTYRGATALLLCRAVRTRKPDFDGAGFYVVDSFEGAGPASEEDLIGVRLSSGAVAKEAFFSTAAGAPQVDSVRACLHEFPRVNIVKGWVPEVLATLPLVDWAFVHLDVNLYRPTFAALEYFWPRMESGGVIVSDDFGSPFTPGARRAWTEFSSRFDVPFIVLGERQAVLLKA